MLKDLFGRMFNGQRECHARLDEAITRSNAARQRASEVCAGIDNDSTHRCAVDWGPSLEAVARATSEDPLADVHLPLDVDGVPSPETERAARARDLRILYPEQE